MRDEGVKKLICIECPKGCRIVCCLRNGRVVKLSGNKCVKGKAYAKREIENPKRILTTTVRTIGLELAVLPVKTDRPIPKSKIFDAMKVIKKIRISKPVKIGSVVVKNISGTYANLISIREIKKIENRKQKLSNW
jgi:CxxC motif-containing protein